MFSQTAEHALRALLYLARQPTERLVTADEIARSIGAPPNYLAKTLNALTKRRLVSGTRGPGGGFRLEVAPSELSVADVIDAFDEPREGSFCLLGGRPCDADAPCVAHERWLAMWAETLEPLRRTTLAELLGAEIGGGVEADTAVGKIPAPSSATIPDIPMRRYGTTPTELPEIRRHRPGAGVPSFHPEPDTAAAPRRPATVP